MGLAHYLNTDGDGDSIGDEIEGANDFDLDRWANFLDQDEGDGDLDQGGNPNFLDNDADGDGLSDSVDLDAYCNDARLNFGESEVDCGCNCNSCSNGGACSASTDCPSGLCSGGGCIPITCADSVLNGEESDVDWGGSSCSSCTDGSSCTNSSDCSSGVCAGNICHAATCSVNIQNKMKAISTVVEVRVVGVSTGTVVRSISIVFFLTVTLECRFWRRSTQLFWRVRCICRKL
ncbi:MAG: hypothetical protein IPJ88_08970 [Myxococcales bacterium]|nr:MAG: hypothetical protein IPJ88_08970 [Myxococcales bacterium]